MRVPEPFSRAPGAGGLVLLFLPLFCLGCDDGAGSGLATQGAGSGDGQSYTRATDASAQLGEGLDGQGSESHEDVGPQGDTVPDDLSPPEPCPEDLPYASEVISFDPGINAGYGQTKMPGVVLGPPTPGSPNSGSLDVLTLGVGGEIVLGFGERRIINGPGADFVVWENPFWQGGNPETPFAELGEVAVSDDGETWYTFPCEVEVEEGFDPMCAGWRPRSEFDPCTLVPLDPTLSGGDPFDLEGIGLEEVRFVRIRDLATEGGAPSAGFDLDAIGAVYLEPLD